MDDEFFREGSPHGIQRTGEGEYRIPVSIPADAHGMEGRECPSGTCEVGFFKVKPGTGVTEQVVAFCPYCRHSAEPGEFLTEEQRQYAIDVATREVAGAVDGMIKRAFGLGPTGRRKFGGGLVSMEVSYKPGARHAVSRPVEEELRRELRCPVCTLEHAVFGLATWCPDCGSDIFEAHLEEEFSVVRKMLSAVDERRGALGARVAARDIENALEDTVSIFEAVLKSITSRRLRESKVPREEIERALNRAVRNQYQNPSTAAAVLKVQVGADLFAGVPHSEVVALQKTFDKRHPITHNLGIIDRKYVERVRTGDLHGRDIRVTIAEVERAIEVASKALKQVYSAVFRRQGSSHLGA